MNNKKGLVGFIMILLIILGIIGGAYVYFLITKNVGSSTDYVYTVEKTNFWHKLFLKDDHSTVYCFDDEKFLDIIKKAQDDNKKIKITYEDYFIRGFFCSSGKDNIGTTIITDVKEIE